MKCYDKLYSFTFKIADKLTEDADTMMHKQKNKAKCIRTIFSDFVKANRIINNYTDITKEERLEKFFGYTGKAANTSQFDKKESKCRCNCQFILSPYIWNPDGLTNDVLVMLDIQDNVSDMIRELFLDFVTANGIVENYTDIPEDERLRKFFGYVERTTKPTKQPGRTVKVMRDKNIEVRQYYDGTRYLFSEVAYTAPDGITARVTVEQAAQ